MFLEGKGIKRSDKNPFDPGMMKYSWSKYNIVDILKLRHFIRICLTIKCICLQSPGPLSELQCQLLMLHFSLCAILLSSASQGVPSPLMACNHSYAIFLKLNVCSCQSLVLFDLSQLFWVCTGAPQPLPVCVLRNWGDLPEDIIIVLDGCFCSKPEIFIIHPYLVLDNCGGGEEGWGVSPLSPWEGGCLNALYPHVHQLGVPGLDSSCQGETGKCIRCRDFPGQT